MKGDDDAKKKTALLFCVAIALSIFVLLGSSKAFADDPKARAIMEKVDAREDGDNATSDMEMILIDKNGHKRERKLKIFSKDFGEDKYRLTFFLSPADVKDTGFLTYDYDDPKKDDDQWLYLPALRKTKRIAASDKSGSFMGSDFNYSDMTSKEIEDYDYTFLKEGKVRGEKVWVIEAIPRSKKVIDETGYTKSWLQVREDNYVVIRAVHWSKDGGRMKYLDIAKIAKIDGIWTTMEMSMTTKSGKKTLHKTVIRFHNYHYNQKLDGNIFTVRRLEKGF